MRVILAALIRCVLWYLGLSWIMTSLLGISRIVTTALVPAFIVILSIANSTGTRRFHRGIHRRERTAGQARLRGPVRRAGAAARCRAGHGSRCACACPRCAGPGLIQGPWQLAGYAALREDEALPGGIRLRYAARPPLGPEDPGSANLRAAMTYMRSRYIQAGSSMMVRLYANPPPKSTGAVSGSGYTRGGQAPTPAPFRSASVNQQPLPPGPHPAACQCTACMPAPATAGLNCTCPSCLPGRSLLPPYTASSPYVPAPSKPRAGWGMDGFDGAPLVAGTALGYRWWTLRAPQLRLNPADAGKDWYPGLLRGVKDFWQPGINQARCLAGAQHDFGQIPHDACSCGFWAYWEIQQHDMGGSGALLVIGVVRASGQVIMGPRGFRAQKAEIVALHLPFRIVPDLPAPPPSRLPDYVRRALPGSSQVMIHRRFTGRVYNYGTGYVPAPFLDPPLPPEPAPPSEEEIQAATDRAVAWEAVIEDRLRTTYPGAEVCATLDLMKAKYPVRSEYVPPVTVSPPDVPCPYCGTPCSADDIYMHVVNNHYF